MRTLILTFGTRGDVQPYAALARALLDAGHEAAVCTAQGFRSLVEQAGVPYLPMGDEMLELVQAGMPDLRGPADGLRLARRLSAAMRTSMRDQWQAARSFSPDRVVYHPKALAGLHVAERLGVPAAVSLPLPFFTPTTAFPVPFVARTLGGTANRLSYQLNRFTAVAYGGLVNEFRRETLGLPGLPRWSDYLRLPDGRPVPALYAYSPAVVPVPPDYPPYAHVTGCWFLPEPSGWRPDPALESFLQAGDPPVYVGLGSMGFGRHARARGSAVLEAVRSVGARAVVATGWGGLELDRTDPDVHVVEDVPHAWLLPRTRAVVHHGGAGTTAAGLRAGRPTLVCPVLGDQAFWGERVHRLGAGPRPLPARRLTATALAQRLGDLTSEPAYADRAEELGVALRAEDGLGHAVRVLEELR